MSARITALVPMRHHSERVPGKNYRLFAGKPLYHQILETLLQCPAISRIVIDTDSPFILEDCAKHFPAVRLVERPAHLRDGSIPMNTILLHDMSLEPSDYYLQTHSTNPLLRTETISRALEIYQSDRDRFDSLFSVTALHTRLWDRQGHPLNHDPSVLLRTQDLPPVYEENSCLYFFSRALLEKTGNRIGARPLLFEVSAAEAWDIDEELDFTIAEFLHRQQHPGGVAS
ncbi:MAG: acylneuraminate cytidylyltransferase family protein [Lentisphaerota bacterium]